MLRFNLSKLDEKIAKLQEIRRLVGTDPEMAELLVACLSEERPAEKPKDTPTVVRQRPLPLRENFVRTGLAKTVAQIAAGFGDQLYTVTDVYKQMVEMGFQFKSKTPSVSVGIELRKLREKGKIDVVRQGSGSTPSTLKNR